MPRARPIFLRTVNGKPIYSFFMLNLKNDKKNRNTRWKSQIRGDFDFIDDGTEDECTVPYDCGDDDEEEDTEVYDP